MSNEDPTQRKLRLQELWRPRLGEMPESNKVAQLNSLNDIPDAVVAVARRLSPDRRAISFISAYLKEDQERSVAWFVQDVVRGTETAATWGRSRFLVPAVSFADQVTLPRDKLLACVGANPELRVVPKLSSWKAGISWVGSPLLAELQADYRVPLPHGCEDLSKPQTEPIGDVDVAVRRWIAARIAGVVFNKLGMNFADAAKVAAEYAPLSSWTHDAQVALAALVRESQMYYPDHPEPPGFRGPDEWFRG